MKNSFTVCGLSTYMHVAGIEVHYNVTPHPLMGIMRVSIVITEKRVRLLPTHNYKVESMGQVRFKINENDRDLAGHDVATSHLLRHGPRD